MRDPREVLEQAREAALAGRFEDALRDQLWFHEHALETAPSLNGVRLTYALGDWVELGDHFPPARAALEAVRDRVAVRLLDGAGEPSHFVEAAAINSALQIERLSYLLFVELDQRFPALAAQCALTALPALLLCEDFALARRYLPAPQKHVAALAARLNEDVEWLAGAPPSAAPRLLATILNYCQDVEQVLAALRGVGEPETEAAIRALALQLPAAPDVREAVQREFDRPGATMAAMIAHAESQ